MNKKNISIVIVLLLSIVLVGCTKKETDEVVDDTNVSVSEETSNYAVEYGLTDGKILLIKKSNEVIIKNTAFSIPENINIAFSREDFDEIELPLGVLTIVPNLVASERVAEVTTDSEYTTDLVEYMAILSSTQCSILEPVNFDYKTINGYTVWTASRRDYCTFGVEYSSNPRNVDVNMYGFELEGYTIVLSVNGDTDKIPDNAEEMITEVIKMLEIK